MRNRFNFSCHIPETSLTPAVSVETFTPLNRFKPDLFHEVRYTAEIKISIKDNQSFTPRLIYIDKLSETETSLIIFQLTYKWVIS